MANTTTKVGNSRTKFNDSGTKLPLASGSLTYYPGAFVGRNSSGYGAKFDDTAQLRFEGVVINSVNFVQDGTAGLGSANGDCSIDVDQPRFLTVAIASAAAGDEGKPVFATYDQTGSYTPTTNNNFIGWCHRVIDSTHIEVEAHYGFAPIRIVTLPYLAAALDGEVTCVPGIPVTVISAILRPLVAGNDGSAVTVTVKKAASATAIGSGTAIHSSTGDLKGTADTHQTLTLTSGALVAAGSAIGLDFGGTLTSAKGTVTLAMITWK